MWSLIGASSSKTLCTTVYILKRRKKQQPLTSTQAGIGQAGHRGVPQVRSYPMFTFVLLAHFKLANATNLCARYCVQAPVCSQGRLATLLVKYHATHAALCLSPSSLVGMQSEPGGAMEWQKKRFKKTGRETAQKEKQFLHFQLLLLTLLPVHVQLGEGEPVICQTYCYTNLPEQALVGKLSW